VVAKASTLAEAQMWHQDNAAGGITVLLALEDIEGEMAGGTEIIMGSHRLTEARSRLSSAVTKPQSEGVTSG